MDDVFVIGDVHGHLDRLEALLQQEGFISRCEVCYGGGEIVVGKHKADNDFGWDYDHEDCINCLGMGQLRTRKDVTVVQLGDLGHFGQDGSPTADTLCYKYVTDNRWADIVLWGNHDRALVDAQHVFRGYLKNYDAWHYVQKLIREGRMKLAYEAHGFLITHAGLALAFRDQKVDDRLKRDPRALVDWLNDHDEILAADENDRDFLAIRDAIGRIRGGRVNTGGIIWRDISEKLYDGFRQVFGHSADVEQHKVRYCWTGGYTRKIDSMKHTDRQRASYCIDIGGKPGRPQADCLAGIYLPSEKIVRVDL